MGKYLGTFVASKTVKDMVLDKAGHVYPYIFLLVPHSIVIVQAAVMYKFLYIYSYS